MVTRFAPSPTGDLHLGHVYAAAFARDKARENNGRYLLRWEDIDMIRCKPEWEKRIWEDLEWLGLLPDEKPWRQSERFPVYEKALGKLRDYGLVYPCFCTRREITAEIESAVDAPHGPDGPLYPGICRNLSKDEQSNRIASGTPHAWRLNSARATRQTGPLTWTDQKRGTRSVRVEEFGDIVLARKDVPTSYHLAVVIDDATQGITLVTRGEDLFEATGIHRLLQSLLGLPVPQWLHHPLVRDIEGRRLAKRDQDTSIRSLRKAGRTPKEITDLALSSF